MPSIRIIVAFATLVIAITPARAQEWPTRPVTMVVPFAAGGPLDVVGRLLASRLSQILDQQVVVENVTGAGGTTGSNRVAKAAPDGHQFVFGHIGTHAFSQTLYKKPPYDGVTDFEPVVIVNHGILLLLVRKELLVSTLAEFIAYAKVNQKKMQFGSAGAVMPRSRAISFKLFQNSSSRLTLVLWPAMKIERFEIRDFTASHPRMSHRYYMTAWLFEARSTGLRRLVLPELRKPTRR